ncbi:AlpA family phage regulatory protein [Methylotuvimicrobium sp. KM2]|uniref:helix-turn-helix transcriptional regulator n=1 Tax=Methylotuvimicrobium sp. KM2 TaxID=3133976 RepID=UPI00310189F3
MKKTIIKRSVLAAKLGVSEVRIKTLIKEDNLPRPIKIGKISGWVESEIDNWIDSKISERDAQSVEVSV